VYVRPFDVGQEHYHMCKHDLDNLHAMIEGDINVQFKLEFFALIFVSCKDPGFFSLEFSSASLTWVLCSRLLSSRVTSRGVSAASSWWPSAERSEAAAEESSSRGWPSTGWVSSSSGVSDICGHRLVLGHGGAHHSCDGGCKVLGGPCAALGSYNEILDNLAEAIFLLLFFVGCRDLYVNVFRPLCIKLQALELVCSVR
jgi:hypothetical protein